MKKTELKNSINEIKRLTSKYPKSINEALNFNQLENETDEDVLMDDEEPVDEPVPTEDDGISIDNFIANMRKESLGIMKKLADNPDDAVYQFAKKIFQLADKAHEDQKEGKDINGQPKQPMQDNGDMQNHM